MWDRIYLRMKNGKIYMFADDRSEVCMNFISLEHFIECTIPKTEKETFNLKYKKLNS